MTDQNGQRERRGRPRALDEQKKRQVVTFIRAGGSQRQAARYVGVSPSTIANEAQRDPEFGVSVHFARHGDPTIPRQMPLRVSLSDIENALKDWHQRTAKDSLNGSAFTKEALKRKLLASIEKEIDEELARVSDGQGLSVVWRVERINESGVFLDNDERRGWRATEWRDAVFSRDGYRCSECGSKSQLQAHHIKPWSEHPDRRFDVDNGQTLCRESHVKKHPDKAHLIKSSYATR